jgi:hypothetical protein
VPAVRYNVQEVRVNEMSEASKLTVCFMLFQIMNLHSGPDVQKNNMKTHFCFEDFCKNLVTLIHFYYGPDVRDKYLVGSWKIGACTV